MRNDYDLVIVGGGIVGASLALMIASRNSVGAMSIAVVEAHDDLVTYSGDQFDPRVVALSARSQTLLADVDVWSLVASRRSCAYRTMSVWDAEGTAELHFDSAELHHSELGHIVENSVLVAALHERVRSLSAVQWIGGAKVEELVLPDQSQHRTELQLSNGRKLSASLVVAADGALSRLRERAGFTLREWSYDHTAIVCTVTTEKPHGFCARQRFTRDGPLAFLPLSRDGSDDHYCSLVWSITSSLAEAILDYDEARFCQQLGRAFEYRLGKVCAASERIALPLKQRHSLRYWQKGVVLVGDAAHTIHPLAGQGVNLGLYDAAVLAEEIIRACERGLGLSEPSILQRYERRRQSHNLAAMASMEGFKRLFGADHIALRYLRNQGMAWVNALPVLKRRLARIAAGQ